MAVEGREVLTEPGLSAGFPFSFSTFNARVVTPQHGSIFQPQVRHPDGT